MGSIERLINQAEAIKDVSFAVIKHPEILRGELPIAASIDITSNCNLRCSHCYFYGKEHIHEELEDESFLKQVRQFRKEYPSIFQCTWVGGEPLWRKELLRESVKEFPINWVVTNGTIPIDGSWYNTAFFISIDGTKPLHDANRRPWRKGKTGHYSVYDRAKEVANRATAPVFVHTVINRKNLAIITELVEEWRRETSIGGFQFSLYTPRELEVADASINPRGERLFLEPSERRKAVETLHRLKERFGDFILMTDKQIELLSPENQKAVFGKNCPIPRMVVSVNSKFQRKRPCVMGPGMSGAECGCVVAAIMHSWKKGDIKSFLLNAGTFFNQPRSRS